MKPFSERYGYKQPKVDIQTDSMDDDLRVGLWNVMYIILFSDLEDLGAHPISSHRYSLLFRVLWFSFFKLPLNRLPYSLRQYFEDFEGRFCKLSSYEVYDLLEFVIEWITENDRDHGQAKALRDLLNFVLESELSGYRVVGSLVTRISDKQETEEIETALLNTYPLDGVRKHIHAALELYSKKQDPDYRNSVKESISAVESLCKIICGNPKATLGEALESIEKKGLVTFHKALKSGLLSLYGYTSDEQGIRHAFTDGKSEVFQEDARFMLVSCSASVNYLIVKADKAGITTS
jgi:hypothetical protein